MEIFTLFVVYKAKPGKARAFVEELEKNKIAEKVRNEDGCLRYDYFFQDGNADEVVLMEEWTSEEKQKIHVTQPHMAELRKISNANIESVRLFTAYLRR